MSKSRWSVYGIVYQYNTSLDNTVKDVISKMSMSYSFVGKNSNIDNHEVLTENIMFSLYNLKYCKENGKEYFYGLVDGDVDLHLKNLSNDIKIMKQYNIWSFRVENLVNEHYRTKEELKKKISMLHKYEQEQVRKIQLDKLKEDMENILGVSFNECKKDGSVTQIDKG